MLRSRLGRSAAVGVVAGWLATTSLVAAEPTAAEEVLRGRGLVRSGASYVLREESLPELSAKLRDIRASREGFRYAVARFGEIVEAEKMVRGIEEEMTDVQLNRDILQISIDQFTRGQWYCNRNYSFNNVQLAQLRALEAERDSYKRSLISLDYIRKKLAKGLPPPAERRKVEESARERSAQFGEKLSEARRLVDAILSQYRKLDADEEIARALGALRREPRSQSIRLRPSDDFQRLVRQLEADEKLLNLVAEGSRTRPTKAAVTRRRAPNPRR